MIDKIRKKLYMYKDVSLIFKYNGSRNQVEEFKGHIDKLYSNTFTIIVDGYDYVRSFSYNDILIHKLVFKSEVNSSQN